MILLPDNSCVMYDTFHTAGSIYQEHEIDNPNDIIISTIVLHNPSRETVNSDALKVAMELFWQIILYDDYMRNMSESSERLCACIRNVLQILHIENRAELDYPILYSDMDDHRTLYFHLCTSNGLVLARVPIRI